MAYRAYFLDSSGWFLGLEPVDADSDEQAIAAVQASNSEAICQLWNDRHLVAKIEPDRLRFERDNSN